jgi:cytochrome c oxidase subunit 2
MSSSESSGRPARRIYAALFVALLPLIGGGWLSGPQSTFDTKGPVAESQLDLFYVTLWVTMVIFVIVGGVLAYATIKFKSSDAAAAHAEPPPQAHGNPLIEMGLIVASILALVIITVPTLKGIWFTYDVPEDAENVYEVTAIGYQWWFKFQYPSEMATQVGGGEAPLVVANELVIPAGRPVRVHLRTTDVIHSFWVPKLAGKVDMIPNRGNRLWLQADEPGYFWGQCAEYCGESHAVMRFRVIALNEEDFAAWVANQTQLAREVAAPAAGDMPKAEFASYSFRPNQPGWSEEFDANPFGRWHAQQFVDEAAEDVALIAKGRLAFQANQCMGCHTVRGHEGVGIAGPDLTHIGARTTIAAGLLENTEENLYRWLTEPNHVKPGNFMYRRRVVDAPGTVAMSGYEVYQEETDTWVPNIEITHEEAHELIAYLNSLK